MFDGHRDAKVMTQLFLSRIESAEFKTKVFLTHLNIVTTYLKCLKAHAEHLLEIWRLF